MIKRSFFALAKPGFSYESLEPDPGKPDIIPVPDHLVLLIGEALRTTKDTLVQTGGRIEKFDRIRLYDSSTEYAVAPASGTIEKIDMFAGDFGKNITRIVIKTDSEKRTNDDFTKHTISPDIRSADSFLRNLPGAPPLKTLADPNVKINTLVVNCADQDLLSTTRQYLTRTEMAHLKEGLQILKTMLNIPKICIAMPQALNLQNTVDRFQTFPVSNTFPDALPEMIMERHLKATPVPGKTPEEQGICFISAEAVISLSKTYDQKEPVFEKLVTVIDKTGTAQRVVATIGTPLQHILSHADIQINDMDRVIAGGPMRGTAIYSTRYPVMPDMDAVMVQDSSDIPVVSDTACVNCGSCVRICPARIPVNLLIRYLAADQYEAAADGFNLESCIECGLCAYVCTARIPLFQYIRLGKHELSIQRADT